MIVVVTVVVVAFFASVDWIFKCNNRAAAAAGTPVALVAACLGAGTAAAHHEGDNNEDEHQCTGSAGNDWDERKRIVLFNTRVNGRLEGGHSSFQKFFQRICELRGVVECFVGSSLETRVLGLVACDHLLGFLEVGQVRNTRGVDGSLLEREFLFVVWTRSTEDWGWDVCKTVAFSIHTFVVGGLEGGFLLLERRVRGLLFSKRVALCSCERT